MFGGSNKLKSVKFPKSAKYINGFSDCTNLENVEFQEGTEYINGFKNIACKDMIIPSSVKIVNYTNYDYKVEMNYGENMYFLGKNTSLAFTTICGDTATLEFLDILYLYKAIYNDGQINEGYNFFIYNDNGWYYEDERHSEEILEEIKKIVQWDTTKSNASEYLSSFDYVITCMNDVNIYCYEDSVLANLKKEEENYNCNVQYITSDTKIPTIPEQKPNNPTTTTTKYTTLPLTTINNQLYVKGINPESNTVEQIIKSGKFAEGTTVKVYKYGQEIANSEKVGTGSVIKVLENGEVKEEYIVVVYGDTDGDGEITSIDALAIVKNKTGKIPFTTEAQKEAARLLTKTGTSGAVDALAIVKSRTGKAVINQENGTVSKK